MRIMCHASVAETVDRPLMEHESYDTNDSKRTEIMEGIGKKEGREKWERIQEMEDKIMEALLGLGDTNKWNCTIGIIKRHLERVWEMEAKQKGSSPRI